MSVLIPEAVEAFFAGPHLGHYVTINPNGTPHVTIIWVGVELNVKEPMIDLRRTFRRYTVPAYILGGLFAAVAIISNLAVTSYGEFNPKPFAGIPALAEPLGYGWGLIVLETSLFLMPTAFFIFLGGFTVGRLITKIGVKTTFIIAGVEHCDSVATVIGVCHVLRAVGVEDFDHTSTRSELGHLLTGRSGRPQG